MSVRPSPESITLQTPIAEADRLLHINPIVVRVGDSLKQAAEMAIANPACRVLSVIDESERLIGLSPVRVLVNDIFLKIVPEEFLGEISDYQAALKYAAHVGARTCGDIMREPVSVLLHDTVKDAFERMHGEKLNGVPITDEDRRVIGYIDQLELLLVWLRATGRDSLLEPQNEA